MVELAKDWCRWSSSRPGGLRQKRLRHDSWAVQVAREHTQRRKILKVAEAYHGVAPAWTPGHGGLIERTARTSTISLEDLESFEACLKRHRGDVAAVIMTPYTPGF